MLETMGLHCLQLHLLRPQLERSQAHPHIGDQYNAMTQKRKMCTCGAVPTSSMISVSSSTSGASWRTSASSCSVEPLLRDCLEALAGLRPRPDLGFGGMFGAERCGVVHLGA